MILDHRGRPAAVRQLGYGFFPSAPVLPRRKPAKAEANEIETTAIGFMIAARADEDVPPDDE